MQRFLKCKDQKWQLFSAAWFANCPFGAHLKLVFLSFEGRRELYQHQYCLLSLLVACTLPLEVCPLWGPGGLRHSATNSQ